MSICALDPEFDVQVDVTDSPLFANLVTHWRGDAETVTELQGHMYQEVLIVQGSNYEQVIEHTRVERHVFSIMPPPPPAPVATFTAFETGPMRAVKIDDPPTVEVDPEDTLTRLNRIDTIWSMEAIKLGKRRFRRTRLFFKLVADAYKTARSS